MDLKNVSMNELLSLKASGYEADVALQVLEPLLEAEKRMILTQLSTATPDLGTYAHLAGRAKLVLQLEKLLEARKASGVAAAKQLNKQ